MNTKIDDGISPAQLAAITPMLALQSGQPYSGNNLAQDRDTVVGYFLDHGYDHAAVTLRADPRQRTRNSST